MLAGGLILQSMSGRIEKEATINLVNRPICSVPSEVESLTLDLLVALYLKAESYESVLRKSYPITKEARDKWTAEYSKVKASVQELANSLGVDPLYSHNTQ